MPKKKQTKSKKETNASKSAGSSSSKKPKTMDELLAMYGGKVKAFSPGDRLKAKVLEIKPGVVVLDIGGKSEGLVKESAYEQAKGYIETLKVGDEVEGKVLVSETPEGFTIISLRDEARSIAWKKLENAKTKKEPVKAMVRGVINPSGVMVDVLGIGGFIPGSHLGKNVAKNTQKLVGRHLEALVIELDRESNRVVLSEKAVSEKEDLELIAKALEKVSEGDIFKGKVTTVSDFGAFVEIKVTVGKKEIPVEGLVHISEFSWEKVEKTEDEVSEGDKVEVAILGVRDGKLALSMKNAKEDPWDKAGEKYEQEGKAKGRVVKISDFGVFVELEPGVEGLIHITKIPPDKKLKVGDEVNVTVEEIDAKERKISLGLVLTAKPVGYK